MSRWFRHYAGMMRDEKLVRVAIKSKQPIERVLWVWGAILESAAEIDDNGRYDLDAAEIAYFLRADEVDIDAIFTALADAGRLAANIVVNWGDRQFSSDRSKDRQAAYRERKQAEKRGSDGGSGKDNNRVTSPSRHDDTTVTAQETETETDTEVVTSVTTPRLQASRLSDAWIPKPLPEKLIQLVSQWPEGRADRELDGFRDYWKSRQRDSARKDWDLVWHNRIRDQHDRIMRDGNNGRNQNNSSRNGKSVNGFAAALQHIADGPPVEPFRTNR